MSILDEAATARRDVRHARSTAEVLPLRGKRNRKVCKKSPNREHDYQPKDRFGIAGLQWDGCVHCGKYK